jgi:dTMP kinase
MPGQPHKGVFISLEGIEGTGKTTQARMLAQRLTALGLHPVLTREPGGTEIGDKIRALLLEPDHREMAPMTELLLYAAARAQHLSEVIAPALRAGTVVITDRFSDSTTAYQGYGRGLDLSVLAALDAVATGGVRPDLTILFDLSVETGLMRNRGERKTASLEMEERDFHERVRRGFLEIAAADPERVRVVDASLTTEAVGERAWEHVAPRIRPLLTP